MSPAPASTKDDQLMLDTFACAAMSAFMATAMVDHPETIVGFAYDMAALMMAEREKRRLL